jgi:hypothetical protein
VSTWHVAAAHFAVPFAMKHFRPQAPQLSTFVEVFTSQPFALDASQSASGDRHVDTPHTPLLQFGVPPAVVQTCPQPPQLSTLCLVSTSQPFVLSLSQSA